MTLIASIPILVLLLGLVMYGFAPSHRHLSLVTIGCGLLVALWQVASRTIHLF